MRRHGLWLVTLPLALAGCASPALEHNANGIRVTLLADESQNPVAQALDAHLLRLRVDAPEGVKPVARFVLRRPGRSDLTYGGIELKSGGEALVGFEPLFTKSLSDLKIRTIVSGNGLTARNVIPCPLPANQGFGAVGVFDGNGDFVVGQFGDRRLVVRFSPFKTRIADGPGR